MATYNGAKYIKEQLQSVLSQLSADDEVIISDDGSADTTIAIIQSFQDKRIRLFRSHFRSPIHNFNFVLSQAIGEYVFLCDQDDIWLSGRVSTALQWLQHYDVVVCDAEVVNENGKPLHPSMYALIQSGPGVLKNFVRNTYYGCCLSVRRKVLQIALPFPKQIPMHDIWLGFVGGLFFTVYFCPQPLVQYRRHSGNLTLIHSKTSLWKKFKYRFNLLRYLPLILHRSWLQV